MNTCPSCNNDFVQQFVCTTCGAEKLYDATVIALRQQLFAANTLIQSHRSEATSTSNQLASRDAEVAKWKDAYLKVVERIHMVGGYLDQSKERDQLRDLLRPFAALLQDHNRNGSDDQPIFGINDATITLGDLRRALAAMEQK